MRWLGCRLPNCRYRSGPSQMRYSKPLYMTGWMDLTFRFCGWDGIRLVDEAAQGCPCAEQVKGRWSVRPPGSRICQDGYDKCERGKLSFVTFMVNKMVYKLVARYKVSDRLIERQPGWKIRLQNWAPRSGSKIRLQDLAPRLSSEIKIRFQDRAPRSGSTIELQDQAHHHHHHHGLLQLHHCPQHRLWALMSHIPVLMAQYSDIDQHSISGFEFISYPSFDASISGYCSALNIWILTSTRYLEFGSSHITVLMVWGDSY